MRDIEQVVVDFGLAWARRDLEAVMAFFADECWYSPSAGADSGRRIEGRGNVRDLVERMFHHDSDCRVMQGQLFSSGNLVFAEWSYHFDDDSRPTEYGCDVFEFEGLLIRSKNAFRKQAALNNEKEGPGTEVYAPRRYATQDLWSVGDRRFKPIPISRDTSVLPFAGREHVVRAAEGFLPVLLPLMDDHHAHFDIGFVILHEGELANWLLFHWWISGGILCQIVARSSHANPVVFEREGLPIMACVWELEAIEHERKAWQRSMMSEQPDLEEYLADTMPEVVM